MHAFDANTPLTGAAALLQGLGRGRPRTVGAPVLPHAVPVAGALVEGAHRGLPVEGVCQRHALHIAAAGEAQEPAASFPVSLSASPLVNSGNCGL